MSRIISCKLLITIILTGLLAALTDLKAQSGMTNYSFRPGEVWTDTGGTPVNAHSGGILFHEGKYYWYGEHRHSGKKRFATWEGVRCYTSEDLYNWQDEGIVLPVVDDPDSEITRGCNIERPKVIHNKKTGKFVMWFHLELKGKGYSAARTGVAVADRPTGPFMYLRSYRPNAGQWPMNFEEEWKKGPEGETPDAWTDEWREAIAKGLFVRRDFEEGQMSRDMTLFVDDDGTAYHIHSAEENLTLHISELTEDYLDFTGRYVTFQPAGHNEAPAIFKDQGTYYLITSGCTGWAPNAARSFRSNSIWGPWETLGNPCVGEDSALTFHSQSTYILPVPGTGPENAFIFMADRWNPDDLADSRYIWLPLELKDGRPVLKWHEQWSLAHFDKNAAVNSDDYKLVWQDEFNEGDKPDTSIWSYEQGFVRNHELQWYQADNARVKDGLLVIAGRRERVVNPGYDSSGTGWRQSREYAEYTSSSINTRGKRSFQYGIFEVRARIDTAQGMWPAIWTLGMEKPWPSNGEIDMMEFYRVDGHPTILANAAWGDHSHNPQWDSEKISLDHFLEKDTEWPEKFHIWKMEWTKDFVRLYLDEELLNEIDLNKTLNDDNFNPFRQPHYILLNLAIGSNGGDPSDTSFPRVYEVDYVRVYQQTGN